MPDTAEIFMGETLKGDSKKPAFAKVSCANRAADVVGSWTSFTWTCPC